MTRTNRSCTMRPFTERDTQIGVKWPPAGKTTSQRISTFPPVASLSFRKHKCYTFLHGLYGRRIP
jgi:hypothetical protein